MSLPQNTLFREVTAVRIELWDTLATFDESAEICPGWNKRDFFAHIAGWEAMVFEAIRDSFAGLPLKPYRYHKAVDKANADFVAQRQLFTTDMARLECEINRFAILTLLETLENVDQSIQLPWGKSTAAEFLHDATEHERNHLNDILKLPQ